MVAGHDREPQDRSGSVLRPRSQGPPTAHTVTPPISSRQDGPSTMASQEEGWWEAERASFIRERVRGMARPGSLVADIGCGRGRLLGDADLGGTVVNVDSHLWETWKVEPPVLFVSASATALPFRDGAFDIVGSFDVLEHVPDDRAALAEQRRILAERGHLVGAVPADRRLWSAHDEAVGHLRRYDTASIGELTSSAGLRVRRDTHFFAFLWLPALLTRTRPRRTEPGNGKGAVSRIMRRSVALVSAFERWVLRHRSIPIGTSVWFECDPVGAAPRELP